jgi:hypothetical protein
MKSGLKPGDRLLFSQSIKILLNNKPSSTLSVDYSMSIRLNWALSNTAKQVSDYVRERLNEWGIARSSSAVSLPESPAHLHSQQDGEAQLALVRLEAFS